MVARRRSPDRIPERPSAIKARLAADRLEARLYRANLDTYAATLGRHAAALGASGRAPTWRDVRDPAVVQALKDRAQVSARSIVATQQARRAALVAQAGSKSAARAPFKEWADGQADRIAPYEAGMASGAAASDFYGRNADVLTGTAHVEPQESAGLDDGCDELIALGAVDLKDATDDLPAHLSCPHAWQVQYDPVEDPSALWMGQ